MRAARSLGADLACPEPESRVTRGEPPLQLELRARASPQSPHATCVFAVPATATYHFGYHAGYMYIKSRIYRIKRTLCDDRGSGRPLRIWCRGVLGVHAVAGADSLWSVTLPLCGPAIMISACTCTVIADLSLIGCDWSCVSVCLCIKFPAVCERKSDAINALKYKTRYLRYTDNVNALGNNIFAVHHTSSAACVGRAAWLGTGGSIPCVSISVPSPMPETYPTFHWRLLA